MIYFILFCFILFILVRPLRCLYSMFYYRVGDLFMYHIINIYNLYLQDCESLSLN